MNNEHDEYCSIISYMLLRWEIGDPAPFAATESSLFCEKKFIPRNTSIEKFLLYILRQAASHDFIKNS